jgi:hypothetical protein
MLVALLFITRLFSFASIVRGSSHVSAQKIFALYVVSLSVSWNTARDLAKINAPAAAGWGSLVI